MTRNVGTLDRMIRLMLGVALIAAPFVSGFAIFAATWATVLSVVVGVVMLLVALTRSCPVYTMLGLRSCKL
ncbi:YgaP family membrane protein [Phaeobacter gallaeciensis]|uniref:Inner membrane protein YgaP-like transmembrane domain-containing protein n=1 Tax=Phaeobacter gallaeciensis TaxID=60890 RepID=A0AAC9Z770_9RHOB|nr:DUF2892 domain-containing protein [Phaeobacter gallaeciensis]AHD09223.1 hypothetical protein Gal_01461 [Phaeobacter gallaeciensis DSM 26640]ATE92486.1 hypothetical protein PhaeoP11_01452 [Phaeobacter gallaeciensis]ATE97692.1 hypothetical protein PhaeoP73_02394 [Phaeobacter gallaeciensis]ATF01151.1 hypothetical protein PhaeoP75_01502 [Phaeobacter gallaeciensis]ATF05531.1 hypothetical protein PhaeoP63_01450 [Phaeobacter gallaeciensis]